MGTEIKAGVLIVLLLGTCGCFSPHGYIVTRTTIPYALPDTGTVGHVGTKSCSIDITQIKEPFTSANLSVMWSNRIVADAMKKAGMTELRYADLHTLSVMNSVYERRRLIFYGD